MKRHGIWFFIIGLVALTHNTFGMTSNNSYDPLPFYTTYNPHEFLYTRDKELIRGNIPDQDDERFNFTITPFGQRSKRARDINQDEARIGDMYGLWNMLALTATCPQATTLGPHLLTAAQQEYIHTTTWASGVPIRFGDDTAFTSTSVSCCIPTDFGKVSVPAEYRKYGVRFETAIMILEDLGFKAQFGVADIQMTVTAYLDATGENCSGTDCDDTNQRNMYRLMTSPDKVKEIATEIGLDIKNYHKTSFEDIRLSLFWRHAVAINEDRAGWPKFLFIPFAQVIGTLATGHEKDPSKRFAVPHGNNGHHSIGVDAGFTVDFDNRVEISFEAGGTIFSNEGIKNMRVPNDKRQTGIFPCTVNAQVSPGENWHFIFTLHSRHFLDKLSFFIQYAQVNHQNDTIRVENLGYFPALLEEQSKWNQRHIISALNYDISPYSSLGLKWQAPISSHRNSPRIGGLYGSFLLNF